MYQEIQGEKGWKVTLNYSNGNFNEFQTTLVFATNEQNQAILENIQIVI
jgi:hypothetical protein